jgi:hypothetical protein
MCRWNPWGASLRVSNWQDVQRPFGRYTAMNITQLADCMSQPRITQQRVWLSRGTVWARLQVAIPEANAESYTLESSKLESNASFVKYVMRHKLQHKRSGASIVLVEKCISKLFFIRSLEARFIKYKSALNGSQIFHHPDCYAVIETPFESILLTQFVVGKAPKMHRIAPLIAKGIRETEQLTSLHLARDDAFGGADAWSMDFFRPWYLLRPRFSFQRYYKYLDAFAKVHTSLSRTAHSVRTLKPVVSQLAQRARTSERCLSHMDYLQKNIFCDPSGNLNIIDWSELKIGRVGFDAGAYLSTLFRRSEFSHFMKTQHVFLKNYLELLDTAEERQSAINNIRYIFLLNSLWYFMRPETLAEHASGAKVDWLKIKLGYLVLIGSTVEEDVFPPSQQRMNSFATGLKLDKLAYGFEMGDLPSRAFRYMRSDGSLSVEPVRLLEDGSLQGHDHRNEAHWSVIDGKLAFLNNRHQPSTIFDSCQFDNGKLQLEGKFLLRPDPEIFHRLEEIDA